MNKYEILKGIINDCHRIVFFTGAGISSPSGIPDFRSEEGLYVDKDYEGYKPEEIISHSFYLKNPELFFKFYKEKMIYPNARPNLAHFYIATLEKEKDVTVVTQNIDGLHTLAGSKNVIELHGNIHRNYCEKCHKKYPLDKITQSTGIPKCDVCGGIIKPDVVLYEEQLDETSITSAIEKIMTCDLLIVIGTSLSVYPAAGFIRYFKGRYIVIINKQKTSFDNLADLTINEDIIKVIEKIQ